MMQFHLGDILSISTGRLVSPSHMDGIYNILNYMTQDNLFTHVLPRASDAMRPYLMEALPWLADITVADDFEFNTHDTVQESVEAWLAEQVERYGAWHEVPSPGWPKSDPIAELVDMVGADKVIAVVVPDEPPSA
jgi:hypothetical protein